MPLNRRQPTITRAEPITPPPKLVSPDDANVFASTVMAVEKLPPSEYDKVRQTFIATGDTSKLRQYEEAFKYRLDQEAGNSIATEFMKEAASLGYTPSELLRYDPKSNKLSEITAEMQAKMYKAKGQAIPRLVIENLGNRPLPFNATIEEAEDAAAAAADPGSKIDEWNDSIIDNQDALRDAYNKTYGASGGVGESLIGSTISSLVVPDLLVWRNAVRELGLDINGWQSWTKAEVNKAITEHLVSLPDDASRRAFKRRLARFSNETWYANDYQSIQLLNNVSDEAVDNLSDPQSSAYVSDILWQGLDVALAATGVAGKLRNSWRGGRTKLTPSQRELGMVRPDALEQVIEDVVLNKTSLNLTIDKEFTMETALGQMPRFVTETSEELAARNPDLGLIPDALTAESRRIEGVATRILSGAQDIRATLLPSDVRQQIAVRELAKREEELAGVPRASQGEIEPTVDGTGVVYRTVLGANERVGFPMTEAIKKADYYSKKGYETRIYTTQGGTKTYLEPTAKLPGGKRRKDFFVEITHRYIFDPEDMNAFGPNVVTGFKWLKKAINVPLTPSAWMRRDLYIKQANTIRERALVQGMEQILAPIRQGLSLSKQHQVDNIALWAENQARTTGRNPTITEVLEAFGNDLDPGVLSGYYTLRKYYDVAYILANQRVYNFLAGGKAEFAGKTALTLTHKENGAMLHGIPLELDKAMSVRANLFNPDTGEITGVSSNALEAIYKKGGQVLYAPLDEKVGKKATNYIVHSPEGQWQAGPLSRTPLKYEPGYTRPHMYEDKLTIFKVTEGVNHNGITTSYQDPIATAHSVKEADDFIAQLRPEEGVRYVRSDDPTIAAMDSTLADLKMMRMEGRLIYDNRGKPLLNTAGEPSEIVNPINGALRLAQILGRQLSVEETSMFMFQGWKKEFVDLFNMVQASNEKKIFTYTDADEILKILSDAVDNQRPRAVEAWASFKHIQDMRGMMKDPSGNFIKRRMTAAGEVFYNSAKAMGMKFVGKEVGDRIANINPFAFTKSLAYHKFIKYNPLRQFPVQYIQPTMIAPLVGRYGLSGKLFRDARNLQQGLARFSIERTAGKPVTEQLLKDNAKNMGMTVPEYLKTVVELEKSGVVAAVDIRHWGGTFSAKEAMLPKTKVGDIGQTTMKIPRGASEGMGLGFTKGEEHNVITSWTAAKKLYEIKNNIKSPLDITRDGWAQITADATDLAGGMVRSNRADWQMGTITSTMFQFLQFAHKAAMTMTGVNRGFFTPKMAGKIAAGQVFLFGLDGLAMGWIPKDLEDLGLSKEWSEFIQGGMVDLVLDKFMQVAMRDPSLNFAWSKYLSPVVGLPNTFLTLYREAIDLPAWQWLMGAGGDTVKGLAEGLQLSWDIVRFGDEDMEWDDATWYYAGRALLDGSMAGVSHARQAQIAWKYNNYATKNGKLIGVAISTTEAWMRLLTGGLQTQEQIDFYNAYEELSTRSKLQPIDDSSKQADAKEYYTRVSRVLTEVGEGRTRKDEAKIIIRHLRKMFNPNDPKEAYYFKKAIVALSKSYEPDGKDIGTLVQEATDKGEDVPAWIINRVKEAKTLDDQTKKAIEEYVINNNEQLSKSIEMMQDTLSIEAGYFDSIE